MSGFLHRRRVRRWRIELANLIAPELMATVERFQLGQVPKPSPRTYIVDHELGQVREVDASDTVFYGNAWADSGEGPKG